MSRFRIPRRSFLGGVGGTAVWLPFLEVMGERRAQAATSRKFLVSFAGTSLGQNRTNQLVPNTVGAGYDIKRGLAPLGETNTMNKFGAYNLRNEVSVVSGMKIPWGTTPPPGGRPNNWHSSSVSPLLSGVRATSASPSCRGVTSDQLVAAALGQGARFKSLEYRVQPVGYRGGDSKGMMSFRKDSTGRIIPNTPVTSPKLAFDNVFSGFTPNDPAEAKRREALVAQDKSILDVVRGNSERLKARLGTIDRTRLERHFDEIRDLERRIATVPALQGGATCKNPTDPGPDPRVATTVEDGRAARVIGYADEDLRGKVLGDLIYMALACDLTRSVSLMLTYAQCFMNVEALVGVRTDLHETGHGSASLDRMSDTIAWQVGLWARIVAKLRDTPDGTGSLLDSSALVLVFEGGHGFDPESGNAAAAHSSENMVALIAGRAGGLKPGKHIAAKDAHPASVIVSAMNAVGVPGALGEVTDPIPALTA